MNENELITPKIYFCADLHIHHKNILKFQKNRIKGMQLKSENDIDGHDNYIINMLKSTLHKEDTLYILGDMMFGNREDAISLLSQIKCNKFFINGNHDKAFNQLDNYFKWKGDIKITSFSKDLYPFLEQDFEVCMCHYPMKSWPSKSYGTMELYGHVHANSLFIDDGDDLCLNVGIDNPICNFKLFSLEQVYNEYRKKLKGLTPRQYINKITDENKHFIR